MAPERRTRRPGNGDRGQLDRLRSPRDVRAVLTGGRRVHGDLLVLHVLPRDDDAPGRLAVAAGRRIGGAVDRNRAKRRLREVLRGTHVPRGVDLVAVARATTGTAPWDDLVADGARVVARIPGSARTPGSFAGAGGPPGGG